MDEQHEITLREEGSDVPDENRFKELLDAVNQLFNEVPGAAKNFIRGKGQQQLARAAEIKAEVIKKLGDLDIERQCLIQERDAARQETQERNKADEAHAAKMYELQTQRFKEVIDAAVKLREMGVDLDISMIAAQAVATLGQSGELPDAAISDDQLVQMADELFQTLDAEESNGNDANSR